MDAKLLWDVVLEQNVGSSAAQNNIELLLHTSEGPKTTKGSTAL